jgi:hypothetical protein
MQQFSIVLKRILPDKITKNADEPLQTIVMENIKVTTSNNGVYLSFL